MAAPGTLTHVAEVAAQLAAARDAHAQALAATAAAAAAAAATQPAAGGSE
jgi:hypothetical protein